MGLEEHRKEIDSIDNQIIGLLMRRFEVIEDIARLKKEDGQPIYDAEREEEVMEKWRETLQGVDRKFVERMVDLILQESKRVQERVR